MRAIWQRLDRRTVYSSWWVELHVDRMRLNDGKIIDHEVVVSPREATGVVAIDPECGVLMIYRHRFIPDTWGWELPAGVIDPGESAEAAAARECEEETGHRPGPLTHLTSWCPTSGFSDQRFHVYLATSAEEIGPPEEANEAVAVEWRPIEQVADDLRCTRIPDGFTQMGLLWAFAHTGRADLLRGGSERP